MKLSITFRAALIAASLSPLALALDLKGPEELTLFTQQVINACSAASGTTVSAGGNHLGEQLMTASTQQVAPLYGRFLDDSTCSGPQPDEADGLLVGLDAVVAVVDAGSSSSCGTGLASTPLLPVTELNGVAGLQCVGCNADAYQFASWREVLRVLYAGMPESAGSDLSQRDCNSDLRHSLASAYGSLFEGGCSGASCSALLRAFRPAESSGAAELLLAELGLPDASQSPFCNVLQPDMNDPREQSCAKDADCASFDCNETAGLCRLPRKPYFAEYQDFDPVRRACVGTGNLPGPPGGTLGGAPPNEPTEQVCGRDGTLGLVLPISPPPAGTSTANYPTKNCRRGVFSLGATSAIEVLPPPTGTVRDRCPNGDLPYFNGCYVPEATDGDTACINGKNNPPGFKQDLANAIASDGRVYNRYLRKGGTGADKGNLATVQRASGSSTTSADVVGAFYKLHTTRTLNAPSNVDTCFDSDPGRTAGCLAHASPCSLGLAAKRAGAWAGTQNLALDGVAPSAENVRRFLTSPPDPLTYPLAAPVYFAAMRGIDKVTEAKQWQLGQCMRSKNKVQSAALFAGLTTLEVDPPCVDYDERECGATFNASGCEDGANLCPDIGVFSVAPLQTSVGGAINVAATGSDPDGAFVAFLWTASSGSFANPEASSTTFTCSASGVHTLTLTIADSGACTDQRSVDVSCL